ncbi:uncharacterized protein EDB91DRAFT_1083196, partial [Suillus paluster]|uniref:uncharacterized protein n=1 Tax=Suillus paluster TaxID=48578 RepID=UPI001B864599
DEVPIPIGDGINDALGDPPNKILHQYDTGAWSYTLDVQSGSVVGTGFEPVLPSRPLGARVFQAGWENPAVLCIVLVSDPRHSPLTGLLAPPGPLVFVICGNLSSMQIERGQDPESSEIIASSTHLRLHHRIKILTDIVKIQFTYLAIYAAAAGVKAAPSNTDEGRHGKVCLGHAAIVRLAARTGGDPSITLPLP